MDHDLSGVNVLICERFWYFGKDAIVIPVRLRDVIKKGPSHKRIRDARLVRSFIDWLDSLPDGIVDSTAENEDHKTRPCNRALENAIG